MEEITRIYQQSLLQFCPNLDTAAWDYIKEGLEIVDLPTKAYFIEEGAIQSTIGFIVKGLIRTYYVDDDGNEITTLFNSEGTYATHYTTFITQLPSKYYLQCLEPTQLVTLPYRHIQEGYRRYENLERYGRLIAEEILQQKQQRIESFQFYKAEQRYLQFRDENPSLFNRISLTHLASYLGIERPSLSRIRKKLAT